MNADGLIAPIVVRWEQPRSKYVIIAGERRYRAARLCGWKTITCDVKPDGIGVGEVAEIQLAENHARKNLNPIELARAFQDVVDKNGYTNRELAKRVGINETTVTRYVRLLSLPTDIQQKIAEGNISVGVAREAARLKTGHEQRNFLKKALSEGYSATDAQRVVSRKQGRRNKHCRTRKSFSAKYGRVDATVSKVGNQTYEHLEEMLKEALQEVRHRIMHGTRW